VHDDPNNGCKGDYSICFLIVIHFQVQEGKLLDDMSASMSTFSSKVGINKSRTLIFSLVHVYRHLDEP